MSGVCLPSRQSLVIEGEGFALESSLLHCLEGSAGWKCLRDFRSLDFDLDDAAALEGGKRSLSH